MTAYHLAQVNIGTLVADDDAPEVADFIAALDPINALADAAPGFVWRLTDDGNDAVSLKLWNDPRIIVNLSVWESLETLRAYVYASDHAGVLRRRREWFVPGQSRVALWWVPAGTHPDETEAKRRAELVSERGPSPEAFTFATTFPPPN